MEIVVVARILYDLPLDKMRRVCYITLSNEYFLIFLWHTIVKK